MATTSIYAGSVTAWNHQKNAAVAWVSREKRVATRQANRLRTVAVLTVLSLIEGAAMYMGIIETWMAAVAAVCICINIPLIGRLVYLWCIEERREEQIRKQSNRR